MSENTVLETAPHPFMGMTDGEHEALSNRGLAIYEEKLRPLLEPEFDNKFVAIHVESEDYEVDTYSGGAMRAIRKRHPQGFLVIMKIGSGPEWGLAARLFAGRLMAEAQKK